MGFFTESPGYETSDRDKKLRACEAAELRAERLERQGKSGEAGRAWDEYHRLSSELGLD